MVGVLDLLLEEVAMKQLVFEERTNPVMPLASVQPLMVTLRVQEG